jgi:hypothetical protein
MPTAYSPLWESHTHYTLSDVHHLAATQKPQRADWNGGGLLQVDVDHWYYAQFEPVMLEAVFYLLRHNETVLADPRATVQLLMKLIGYWDEATPPQGNPEGLLNGHWYVLPLHRGVLCSISRPARRETADGRRRRVIFC